MGLADTEHPNPAVSIIDNPDLIFDKIGDMVESGDEAAQKAFFTEQYLPWIQEQWVIVHGMIEENKFRQLTPGEPMVRLVILGPHKFLKEKDAEEDVLDKGSIEFHCILGEDTPHPDRLFMLFSYDFRSGDLLNVGAEIKQEVVLGDHVRDRSIHKVSINIDDQTLQCRGRHGNFNLSPVGLVAV
ncbi:hypothetical protein HY024_01035 [Candidatus Curtissbacteria bacterium]|nr:hypothetical protein [Candidatus Curtissbacteria bacterium]